MPIHEMINKTQTTKHLAPAVYSTTQQPTAFDTTGCGKVGFLASVGTAGITLSGTNKITLALEESDDNSTFTTVAAADALGDGPTVTLDDNTKAGKNYRLDYKGKKQYVRVTATFAGTHGTGTPLCVNALAGEVKVMPVTND